MFDLVIDGAAEFFRRRPGAQKIVRREPLSGIVDGANRTFLVPHHPLLAASFYAWFGETQVPSNGYLLDAAGGVVQFVAPPALGLSPVADYTAVPLTEAQVVAFAWAGFDLMESLWLRGLLLSSDKDSYVMALPDSAHAYIVDGPVSPGDPVHDPACGARTFSESRTQIHLLARCIELAYLDSLSYEAAATDLNVHERGAGIAIDASRRPANLLSLREAEWTRVRQALYAAMEEAIPEGGQYADRVAPRHTSEYETIWHWQTGENGILFAQGRRL